MAPGMKNLDAFANWNWQSSSEIDLWLELKISDSQGTIYFLGFWTIAFLGIWNQTHGFIVLLNLAVVPYQSNVLISFRGWGYQCTVRQFLRQGTIQPCKKHMLDYSNHIHVWHVSSQLSCADTCQIWTCCSIGKWCFEDSEKMGKQWNAWNWFSNPHPWITSPALTQSMLSAKLSFSEANPSAYYLRFPSQRASDPEL